MVPCVLRRALHVAAFASTLIASFAFGQSPSRRLLDVPAGNETPIALENSVSGRPQRSELLGDLPGDTALTSMSLVLKPSDAQESDLTALLVQQQDPSSSNYHHWLSPEEYGQRFGVADADLTILQDWLQARGFTVDAVAPSRNRVVFSGTSAAVENAFHVSMRRYQRNGRTFFENSSRVELPASLAAVVGGVSGLSSYRLPAPQSTPASAVGTPVSTGTIDVPEPATAEPNYTTSTGTHYLVPWDFRQIFGMNSLIGSGYDGTGVKIGIIGQSAVDTTQLTYFQQKTGQTVKLPTMVLVPNTGVSNKVKGDEGESELDLEYASGSAPGASVQFIYTGCTSTASTTALAATVNCNNNGVFDAIAYAITNNVAPILSLSYGGCEADDASYATSTMEPILRQANTQGQTIMVSSGDAGAASCESGTATTLANAGLAVSYPASSPYVTAVGGTTLNGDTSTYWSSSNNSNLGSAIGYIPEVAWNDTATYKSFASSGGGVSKIFGKPSWQTGTGVPADGHRDVPDVAFPANVSTHAYAVCGESATCLSGSNGFVFSGTAKDGGGVGGTSAAAPNFAAMMAIIQQAGGGTARGNINPSLYALAAGSSAGSIFHDITSGNNQVFCSPGTADCTGNPTMVAVLGYVTTTGYDLVTGLGSIAAPALLTGLQSQKGSASPAIPTVSLTASNSTPVINTPVTFTAGVTGQGATGTGTVTFAIDGTKVGSAVALASGSATYTLSGGFTTAGSHTVSVTYSGDGNFAAGSASLTLTASTTASITMSSTPSTLTIAAGSSGSETISIVSTGFAGSLSFTAALTSASTASFPYCLSITPISLTAGATRTATLTINTASSCATAGSLKVAASDNRSRPQQGMPRGSLLLAAAGIAGCITLRRRLRPAALLLVAASALAFGLSGCGSGSSASTSSTSTGSGGTTGSTGTSSSTGTTGTYGLRITATSTSNTTVTANTTFTLVVQ